MQAPSRRVQLVAASVAISLLSLLVWRIPAYDPTAWLIWGRQLTEGTLEMEGGPSWKPLTVVVTYVFMWTGDDAGPALWLLTTRLSGFAAIALVYVLTRRLGGRTAAIVAAAGLALATDFLFNCFRGDSEGLLVAFTIGAFVLHVDERRWWAFASLALAAGIRPEVWPLLLLYGLWLVWAERRAVTFLYIAAGGLAVLAAWFVPDHIVTGDWFRGGARAQNPVPGSPAQSAFPFGMTLLFAAAFLTWPLVAAAVVAVRDARGRDPRIVVLGAVAVGLMLLVALMSELGFTGNIRYATLPGAVACVLGGLGMERLVALVRARVRPRLAQLLAAAGVLAALVSVGIVVNGGMRLSREERIMGAALDEAFALAGGERRITACGQVSATPFERQRVAWLLDRPQKDILTRGVAPGIAFLRRGKDLRPGATLPLAAETDDWVIRATCTLPSR